MLLSSLARLILFWEILLFALLGTFFSGCVSPASHVLLEDQRVAETGRSRFTAGGSIGALIGSKGPSFGGGGSWRIGVAKDHEVGVSASAAGFTFGDTLSGPYLGLTVAHKWRFSRYLAWSNRLGTSVYFSGVNVSPQIDTALIAGTDMRGAFNLYGGLRLGGGFLLSEGAKSPLPWALGLWLSGGVSVVMAPGSRFLAEIGFGTQFFTSTSKENGVDVQKTSPYYLGLASIGFEFWPGASPHVLRD